MTERRPLRAMWRRELLQLDKAVTAAVAVGTLLLPHLVSYTVESPKLSEDFSCVSEYDPGSGKLYASLNNRPGASFFDYQLHSTFHVAPIDIDAPPATTEISADYATAITLADFNTQAARQGSGLLQAGEAVTLNFTVYANAGVYQGQGLRCQEGQAKL